MRVRPAEYVQGEFRGVIAAIGNTPLIDLTERLSPNPSVKLLAKIEFLNPGGSIKDRAALYIVMDALQRGLLKQGKVVLDATSGNMGIALALVTAALGFKAKLVMPANANKEKQAVTRLLGAEIVLTDPLEEIDGAIREAKRLAEESPDYYCYVDQYSNPANVKAHYETTGVEIIRQTDGKVTHFVAGVGTSGTLIGTGKRLKEHNPRVKIVEVQPSEPLHGIEGLKHMASSLVPALYDPDFADERVTVSSEEAYRYCRILARKTGILAGLSSGANLAATLEVARQIKEGVVVTVFPDGASRYVDLLFKESGDVT